VSDANELTKSLRRRHVLGVRRGALLGQLERDGELVCAFTSAPHRTQLSYNYAREFQKLFPIPARAE
jgi:hypothetical protein